MSFIIIKGISKTNKEKKTFVKDSLPFDFWCRNQTITKVKKVTIQRVRVSVTKAPAVIMRNSIVPPILRRVSFSNNINENKTPDKIGKKLD
jgi:hypothetical protein